MAGSNAAIAESMTAASEEPGFLDTLAYYDQYNTLDAKGVGAAGHKGGGIGGVIAQTTGHSQLGGASRMVSGAGRMLENIHAEDKSKLDRTLGMGRGVLEMLAGSQDALGFLQDGEAALSPLPPAVGGVLGLAKMADAFGSSTNEGGMSVIDGLDAAQGGLSAVGAFGGAAPTATLMGSTMAEIGAMGLASTAASGAAVLGAGVAGWKAGDWLADHTAVDEIAGDVGASVVDGIAGPGALAEFSDYVGQGYDTLGRDYDSTVADMGDDMASGFDGVFGPGALAAVVDAPGNMVNSLFGE